MDSEVVHSNDDVKEELDYEIHQNKMEMALCAKQKHESPNFWHPCRIYNLYIQSLRLRMLKILSAVQWQVVSHFVPAHARAASFSIHQWHKRIC